MLKVLSTFLEHRLALDVLHGVKKLEEYHEVVTQKTRRQQDSV